VKQTGFALICKSRSRPFLEPTITKQWL